MSLAAAHWQAVQALAAVGAFSANKEAADLCWQWARVLRCAPRLMPDVRALMGGMAATVQLCLEVCATQRWAAVLWRRPGHTGSTLDRSCMKNLVAQSRPALPASVGFARFHLGKPCALIAWVTPQFPLAGSRPWGWQ